MTTIMELAQHDPVTQNGPPSLGQPNMQFHIKRIGGRPLRFEGIELAMAMSYTPQVPFWYEINLYRSMEQNFIATVRLFHQSQDMQDTVRAWEVGTIDEAIKKLTDFDAAHDVPVQLDCDYTKVAAAVAASTALQMLANISEARTHYKSLVGEFLFDLHDG
jgi:hypothetical protein